MTEIEQVTADFDVCVREALTELGSTIDPDYEVAEMFLKTPKKWKKEFREEHGDFSCNAAITMVSALRDEGTFPRIGAEFIALADTILEKMEALGYRAAIFGPCFVSVWSKKENQDV